MPKVRVWKPGESLDSEYRGGWVRDSIEHPNQPEGGRGIELYEALLRFSRKELKNKTVLDLGAGPEAKLDKELQASGIQARVVELSPDFIEEEHRTTVKKSLPDVEAVAGLGQTLPFPSESFDRVLAVHLLDHIKDKAVFYAIFREIARVLRKGGQALVGPAKTHFSLLENDVETMQYLHSLGIKLSRRPIPEKVFSYRMYDDMTGAPIGMGTGETIVLEKR